MSYVSSIVFLIKFFSLCMNQVDPRSSKESVFIFELGFETTRRSRFLVSNI